MITNSVIRLKEEIRRVNGTVKYASANFMGRVTWTGRVKGGIWPTFYFIHQFQDLPNGGM